MPFEPLLHRPIRWGIAATGSIASSFVADLAFVDDATAAAVCSRTPEAAAAFAARHNIPRHHGSYQALADDPDVDVVYVATPQSRHLDDTIMFLEAGKHVLCEKPFALNAAQARQMCDVATANNRFVMEAMWARFLPSYVALRDVLNSGRIGTPLMVESSFGVKLDVPRLYDLSSGGGALLDLGIYPVHLSEFVLGPPDVVHAVGHIGASGVDESVGIVMHHRSSAVATAQTAIRTTLPNRAAISGTDGRIELPSFMHCPTRLNIFTGDERERIETPWTGVGLHFQVAEVHRCLRSGVTESDVMPLDDSISMMSTLDAIRAQLGVVFPGEAAG
jgi:predicted dehydrogenase